uniref:TRIO and F-actin binding protein n=1 Tax=Astyanax mexicanus TaxID=7994 RepID=A0A3B1JS47_ASTMX
MPFSGDDLVCPKFQPNIFNSSRCHDCLRLEHAHTPAHTPHTPAHTPTHTPQTPAHTTHTPAETHEREVNPTVESSGNISSQKPTDEERDTSNKEESDEGSVVSSCGDVSAESLCILSPGCDLYLYDRDHHHSSDSQSEDDSSGSVTPDEDFRPFRCHKMTRLDSSSHRANPRAWMEEARSRDSFGRHSLHSHVGSKADRDRESGYFSLGRAAGTRAFRDKSPPPPHRHSERGHPLPSNRTPEPKATIPFRNPDLGVPSYRRTTEVQNQDLEVIESYPPDPVDLSIEVEAQVGPRSPSPTPFKQAESLATSSRRGLRTSHSSSYQQSGNIYSSRQSSSISRSSSPARNASPFKPTESVSSFSSRGFGASGGFGTSGGFGSQKHEQRSRSPTQSSYSRQSESAGLQKNFRSFASSVGTASSIAKSVSNSYADLRSGLRKPEVTNSGYSGNSQNISSRWKNSDSPGQSLIHKSETNNSLKNHGRESRSSSPPRRGYDASQSSLHKVVEGRRSASPVRKGYGAPSKSESSQMLSRRDYNSTSSSLSRRNFESTNQMRKSEINSSTRSHSRDSRHSSPSRRSYDAPPQSVLRKSEATRNSYSSRLDNRSPSPSRRGFETPNQPLLRKSETSNCRSSQDPRSSSPLKSKHEPTGQSPLHKTRADSSSYVRTSANSSTESWRGSTYSLHSQPMSRSSSPPRKSSENKSVSYSQKQAHVAWDNTRSVSRSSSRNQQSQEVHSLSPEPRRSSNRNRSPSPQMHRHTSSQSSMDSFESGQRSAGSSGLDREEYAIMADLPKVKTVFQKEGPGRLEKLDSRTRDEPLLYKPASHSHSKVVHKAWDESGDQKGAPTSAHHTQGSRPSVYFSSSVDQAEDETPDQPDLLNFKKGWMSKQDRSGEWKKHWFVLTDAGLKYYRDSGAEEKDELDGEIDLKSCLKVSEFDVERNYGFQIQTKDGVYTLSAMTAGIRRNWIEVLKKSIRPSSSPDLTQLPESSSDKENSRHSSSRRLLSQSETPSNTNPAHRRFDYVELSHVATPSPAPANQREAGEGQVRDHGQWQEERSQDATHIQWEAVLQRKGPGTASEQKRIEEEIERKWAEFERLPLKEMRSLPALGTRSGPLANEALQREVASLRQQLARVQGDGGVCGVCVCGGVCGGVCSVSVEQMERAHRQALEELQRKHERQSCELKREKERLLQEEIQATTRAMESLKKAHKEELEREVQKAKSLATHTAGTNTLRDQQQIEVQSLGRELGVLSEQYSQKCVELNRAELLGRERERDVSQKEREIEQLKKENQDLHTRLTEKIRRMRSFVTGQGSEEVANDKKEHSACELQVLLRVKQNEVEYLQKEIMCLRNEVQFLNTEKQSVCERYQGVCEELRGMKERSEREIHALKEHLRLAMAALQEGQQLSNSLQH